MYLSTCTPHRLLRYQHKIFRKNQFILTSRKSTYKDEVIQKDFYYLIQYIMAAINHFVKGCTIVWKKNTLEKLSRMKVIVKNKSLINI